MKITDKIKRIQNGHKPKVLDLFAGCGGISLGFESAGFKVVAAIEIDAYAAKSHAMNFFDDKPDDCFKTHSRPIDITEIEPEDFANELGMKGPIQSQIDVIVGGPPCQAFARVGRAKLREVAEHPEAFLKDPRSNLYLRYLDYVRAFQPSVILMENVPDVLNYGGHNIADEVCEVLDVLGYEPHYTTLNAVYYGVPEMRERMFLLAYHKSFAISNWFPDPTHWIDLPKGYFGSRQVALKTIQYDLFGQNSYYLTPPRPSPKDLIPAVTAEDALSDLPRIEDDSEQKLKKGPRYFDKLSRYPKKETLTEYQKLMRNWTGFEAREGVFDHVIRYLPRDYKIFMRMQPGDQYPQAHDLAIRMFNERIAELKQTEGKAPRKGTKRYQEEWKKFVPPYDPGKFPNKWRKMEPDMPARTLMAHLGKDSYSHIHYDSTQARTISVREAARLQSFPDGFVFKGPMNPAFRQIGNAVPPLMAKALAETIYAQLTGEMNIEEKNCRQKAIGV